MLNSLTLSPPPRLNKWLRRKKTLIAGAWSYVIWIVIFVLDCHPSSTIGFVFFGFFFIESVFVGSVFIGFAIVRFVIAGSIFVVSVIVGSVVVVTV